MYRITNGVLSEHSNKSLPQSLIYNLNIYAILFFTLTNHYKLMNLESKRFHNWIVSLYRTRVVIFGTIRP